MPRPIYDYISASGYQTVYCRIRREYPQWNISCVNNLSLILDADIISTNHISYNNRGAKFTFLKSRGKFGIFTYVILDKLINLSNRSRGPPPICFFIQKQIGG